MEKNNRILTKLTKYDLTSFLESDVFELVLLSKLLFKLDKWLRAELTSYGAVISNSKNRRDNQSSRSRQ